MGLEIVGRGLADYLVLVGFCFPYQRRSLGSIPFLPRAFSSDKETLETLPVTSSGSVSE